VVINTTNLIVLSKTVVIESMTKLRNIETVLIIYNTIMAKDYSIILVYLTRITSVSLVTRILVVTKYYLQNLITIVIRLIRFKKTSKAH